jgi:glycerate kinase
MHIQLISPIPFDAGQVPAPAPAVLTHRPKAAMQLTEAVVNACRGSLHAVTVTGPTGDPVFSWFGMLDHLDPPTALIQACAIGEAPAAEDGAASARPSATTSWGLGELVCAAMDEGAQRIVLIGRGCRLADQGAGMARALGERMPHRNGKLLETDVDYLADRLGARLQAHHRLLASFMPHARVAA